MDLNFLIFFRWADACEGMGKGSSQGSFNPEKRRVKFVEVMSGVKSLW